MEDTCPFCGATDTPVLDFWLRLPWGSKPGWTHLHAFLPVRYSSDSPLMQHLLTSWLPAWQLGHFDPHTCSRQMYPQALVASRSEPWLEPMAWAGARTHDLPCRSTAHLTTWPFRLGSVYHKLMNTGRLLVIPKSPKQDKTHTIPLRLKKSLIKVRFLSQLLVTTTNQTERE